MDAFETYDDLQVYSLEAFNTKAAQFERLSELPDEEDAGAHLVDFVLTGRNNVDEHQAIVDVNLGSEPNERLVIFRDYDSLIGICPDIRVQRAVNIYPVSNPTFALTTSIHLGHFINVGGVSAFLSLTYA